MRRIPVKPGRAHQTIILALSGRRYRLTLDWNQRVGRWFLSLSTAAGESIVRSKAVVLGADLLRQSQHKDAAPPGALILYDRRGVGAEAALDTLGTRHRLYYVLLDEDE